MKRRIFSLILVLALCCHLFPTAALAEETSPGEQELAAPPEYDVTALAESQTECKTIRVLNGTITKKDLYQAFGGKEPGRGTTNYRYTLCDQTAWKRVNQEDSSSTEAAENVQSGKLYQLQKKTYTISEDFKNWKDLYQFQFQTYYQIAITTDEIPSAGGVSVTGGSLVDGNYEVNHNETLTLTFTPVDGYAVQIKNGNEAWITVTGNTYTHTANASTTLSVRYVTKSSSNCRLTVTIQNPLLGTYEGIETDSVPSGTQLSLRVVPYNELTCSDNDQDAYVKSVTVNGQPLSGTYNNTVFTKTVTVTADTTIVIEFAKRLVLRSPAEGPYEKYSGDSPIYMYRAAMNMDKKVSEQVSAIEASILASTVDTTATPGYESIQIELKGNLQNIGDVYLPLDANPKDQLGELSQYPDWILNLLVGKDHWGNATFHNDKESWEEIRLVLPASEDGIYPAVQSEDLTVWVVGSRPELKIQGTTAPITVESEGNLKASITAVVQQQLLTENQDTNATLDKIGIQNISCQYSLKFSDLTDQQQNVSVTVTVKKGEHYLKSTGTITVPVSKATQPPNITVKTDGQGSASYTANGNQYTVTLTPDENWYVQSLTIETTSPNNSQTISLAQMTSCSDGQYSYSYSFSISGNASPYTLTATFVQYQLTVTAPTTPFLYYEGKYSDNNALTAAIQQALNLTSPPASFPIGTMRVEYQAATDCWLPIGAAPSQNGSHTFGSQASETVRCCYQFVADGFTVYSDAVTLSLSDGRTVTQLKTTVNTSTISYADYTGATNRSAFLLQHLLDGVYLSDGTTKLETATVTISPDPDYLEAGQTTLTLSYSGDTTYQPSQTTVTLTLTPLAEATVAVDIAPTAVTYGDPYTVTVTTTPENLQTIRFAIGIDLEKTSLNKRIVPVSITIQGQETLLAALREYAWKEAETTAQVITAKDVIAGVQNLLQDADKIRTLQVSTAALKQLSQMLEMTGFLESMEVILGNQNPANTGFYMIGAIVSAPGYQTKNAETETYEAPMALNYLSITPKNIKATLGWAHELENHSVTKEQLNTGGWMDATVETVESGSADEAAQQLVWFYMGLDDDNGLTLLNDDELELGAVYTQVAFLKEWIRNEQYSSVPITREFALGVSYADVQFVDHNNTSMV